MTACRQDGASAQIRMDADLDDDGVGRQVDSPGQGGCTDQDLDVTSGEHALHQVPVRTQHAGVVDTKTFWEDLSHLLVSGALHLTEERGVKLLIQVALKKIKKKKGRRKVRMLHHHPTGLEASEAQLKLQI